MLRAAFIGAVLAFVCLFLVAALYGAVFGMEEMFAGNEHPAFGFKGAWTSVSMLLMFGQVFPVLFPSVALAGAAMGIILRGLTRSLAKNGAPG